MTSTKTPLQDIAADLAAAHGSDPLVTAAGPSADDVTEFDLCALRDALDGSGWDGSDEALRDELRDYLRAALQVEADAWAAEREAQS